MLFRLGLLKCQGTNSNSIAHLWIQDVATCRLIERFIVGSMLDASTSLTKQKQSAKTKQVMH